MTTQRYRSIYFPDAPGSTSKEKNITIAFGAKDELLHLFARTRSSEELRQLLGHPSYVSLRTASEKQGVRLSSYVKARLRTVVPAEQSEPIYDVAQLPLEGF